VDAVEDRGREQDQKPGKQLDGTGCVE